MRKLFVLAISVLTALVVSTFNAAAERRVALVIGNSQYKNPSLSLANPRNDAEDIAATLKALGFETIQAFDATKSELDTALARFARASNESDSALFYYAGHAMQYQGRNYLMPVDAELEDEFSLRFNMVSIEDVRAALDRASGVRILVLDACRNNPLSERLTRNLPGGRTRAAISTRGLARIDKTQGMVVAYATAAEDVAIDGTSGRNSPFTRALLKRMQEPGREITKMFQLVAADVRTETQGRQVPELSISLADDYYLNQNDRIIWEKLREANDIPAIREFIERYPYSIHVWAARKRLDDLERWARERETQQRLQFEATQRRELEKQLEELRKQQAEAAEAEKRRAAEEAERRRAEAAEAEKRRAEEAKRIAAIEAEQKRIAEEQEVRRRAEADRKAKEADAARKAKEEEAQKQNLAAKTANEDAERKRREEAAAREAEETRKQKEEAQRLAKLEEERVRARREQEQQEAARKFAEQQRELACRKERATYGMMENDLSKLTSFAATSACDEVRAKANERIAALNTQAQTCKSEGEILELFKGAGPDKRDQLVQFEQQITCDKLRPTARSVLAKLDADAKIQLIRNTQVALRQIGCFTGPDTGKIDNSTNTAIKRYRSRTDGDEANLAITPELLNEIKTREPNTCPVTCPSGQIMQGDTCVAAIDPRPPVQARRPVVQEKQQFRPVVRERPRPVAQERHTSPPPAPRAEAKPAQQRALGVGF